MEAINIIGVLCLILTFFATIGLFILWRFSNILFQLEHDRVYKVEKVELENKALWLALENLGVTPDEAIMIGDNANDVNAAKGAGIPVIVCRFGYTHGPAEDLEGDLIIEGFDDLPDAFDRLP